MTDKLKPVRCGCGGEAYLKYHDGAYSVMCTKCRIETTGYCNHFDNFKSAKEYATKDWNRAMGGKTAKVETVGKPNVYKCSECGQYFHQTSWGSPVEYCSRCGARLDWSGDE